MSEARIEDAKEMLFVCKRTNTPLSGGGRGVVFIELDDSLEGLGKERIFSTKNFKRTRIGCVYSMKVIDDASFPSTLRFERQYDAPIVAEWQALQTQLNLEDKRLRELSAAPKNGALIECLKPLRRLHQKAAHRDAFELIVLRYLRTGELE